MQASTLQGLTLLAGLAGVNLTPELQGVIVQVIGLIYAVIQVFKDGKNDTIFKK